MMDARMKTYELKLMQDLIIIQKQMDEITTAHLDKLKKVISHYLHSNYSSIVITDDELNKILMAYHDRNYRLKKELERNLGEAKFKSESGKVDTEEIIEQEVTKIGKMFNSVLTATNSNYVGLVNECVQELMGLLIRKNSSLTFAKNTEKIRKDLEQALLTTYQRIMKQLGQFLLDDIYTSLTNNYLKEQSNKSVNAY